LSDNTHCHGILQLARDRQCVDNFELEQVHKIWRTFIVHTMVPTCRLPEVVNSEWGTDRDAPNFEIGFSNTHRAGMIRQLSHHSLEVWKEYTAVGGDDSIDDQAEVLHLVEMLRPLGSDLDAEMDHHLYCN